MKNRTATIILAAGKGTRMKSDKPKVVFPLGGKPMVQRVVDTARELDSDRIVLVIGHKPEEVKASLDNFDKVRFAEQKEQHGTGHAVMVTEEAMRGFSGTVFILCGDVPLLKATTCKKMLAHHLSVNAACTVLTAVMDDPQLYGRIVRNEKGSVQRIREFKDASEEEKAIREINTGIYCFDADALNSALKRINNNNAQKEYYLTDTLEILNRDNKLVSSVLLDNLQEASGVNSQKQLAELEVLHYEEIRNHWLTNGVTMENPPGIIIHDTVKLSQNVSISANTQIKGNSRIGNGVVIGPNCLIREAVLEADCTLAGYNIIEQATLTKGTELGYYEKKIEQKAEGV